MKVDWSDRALERIDEIADHIALDHPVAAEQWVAALFVAAEQLSEFPLSGRVVPEVENDEVRELIYGAYRVLYQVRESVEILTVRHGSQLLREDEVGGERT